jgi:hypothetical protein
MSIRSKASVIGSKPVAQTIRSNAYSASLVRMPVGVLHSIGVSLMSTSLTLGWL